MGLYRWAIRPLLFALDAEASHRATSALCRALARSDAILAALERQSGCRDARLETTVAGLRFPSPVGLAAGFDKNGVAVDITSRLGFGFVEVGSVSAQPSAGNPQRPRIWRLPADEGLRVYYGCPNDGAATVAARLRHYGLSSPLGINLVETNTGKLVGAEQAADELALAMADLSASPTTSSSISAVRTCPMAAAACSTSRKNCSTCCKQSADTPLSRRSFLNSRRPAIPRIRASSTLPCRPSTPSRL